MNNKIILAILLLIPIIGTSQLNVEGVYQMDNRYVSLLLSNEDTDPLTGYTSFQLFTESGDTITLETGPDYFLPNKNSSSTYKLKLKDEFLSPLSDMCGKLKLKNPEQEIEFCLDEQYINTFGGFGTCDDYGFKPYYSGEYWTNEISILVNYTNLETGGIGSGYTSFQLFDENNDTLTFQTGPDYFLPVGNGDTYVYNLKLLNPLATSLLDVYEGCFALKLTNPECNLSYCNLETSVIDTDNTQYKIYPNPFYNNITIEGSKSKKVEIVDASGRVVFNSITEQNNLDLHNLNNGIYFIKIENSNKIQFHRIVKIN